MEPCIDAIDDSNYLEEVKFLKEHAVFAAEDMTSFVSFINTYSRT
jgi:hypothetical protein